MKDVTVVKVTIVSAPSAAAVASHSRMKANLGRGRVAPPGWTPTLSPSQVTQRGSLLLRWDLLLHVNAAPPARLTGARRLSHRGAGSPLMDFRFVLPPVLLSQPAERHRYPGP
jgi:hypothetical protein